MRRKLLALLLSLVLLAAVLPCALAASELPQVIDKAGLLSASERDALETKAAALREEYEMDVVILTVDSLHGKQPQDYADDYYDENGYGCGEEKSGLLFLISMEERDWYISTCGEAIYAFTDYGIQQVGETALPYLSDGEYYEAFDAYLDELPAYFSAYRSSASPDGYADTSGDTSGDYSPTGPEKVAYYAVLYSANLKLSLLLGLVVAGITVLVMRASMNTKRLQSGASDYLKQGSFHLNRQQDLFLYSHVSKTHRPQNNDSSDGGGSSTHTSSSGTSHGGGGGKF